MNKKTFLLFSFIFISLVAFAGDSIGWRQYVTLDARPSYTFSSFKDDYLKEIIDVECARDTKAAASLHLQYGFSFPSYSRQGRISPDAWQGIGASVNFLGNHTGLGTPIGLYVYQGAPIWRMSQRWQLYYEWNFGASFGWRPCDGQIAYSNLIVGSRVNAYINLGLGVMYRLSDSYSLMAGIDATHFSNGNTSYPNPGVNMAGLRVGLTRTFRNTNGGLRRAPQMPDTLTKRHRPDIDLTLYGAWRKRVYRGDDNPVLLGGHFAVAGLDVAPMWRVSRNFRAGASVDFQWDESTDLKRHQIEGTTGDDVRFTRPDFFSQVCVGVSGRAELVMPIFSVNVGIGYNFVGPPETRASYQLANLKVRLTDRFFLNVGYQLLNFQRQNNLMLGLGYSI